jgi:hypothetical protein
MSDAINSQTAHPPAAVRTTTILNSLMTAMEELKVDIIILTAGHHAIKRALDLPFDLDLIRNYHLELREYGTDVANLVFLVLERVERTIFYWDHSEEEELFSGCLNTSRELKESESALGLLDLEVGQLLSARAWHDMLVSAWYEQVGVHGSPHVNECVREY